ncbi:MAG: sulfotransferase domain-containing protein [Chromatiales bacterium]
MVASKNNFITIVSGLPRSGTSMMMQMLEAGGLPALTDSIRAADSDNPHGYHEFERVKQLKKDSSWLLDAYGKAVKMVYLHLYNLPKGHEYRVIFMRRHLNEVIASQRVMLERLGKPADFSAETALTNKFKEQLQKVDVWIRSQTNLKVLYLDYREVLDASCKAVTKLDEFLDSALDRDSMIKAIDRSLYRQREL